jgi:PRC-barrel domain
MNTAEESRWSRLQSQTLRPIRTSPVRVLAGTSDVQAVDQGVCNAPDGTRAVRLEFSCRGKGLAPAREERMAQTTAAAKMTGKPLIESDRVEGTTVYDPRGNNIGSIKRLMIEKISGKVVYAVMSFGGFLGVGADEHTIPWNKLDYDTNLGGYRTDITEEQLRGAPGFYRDRDYDWSDRNRERELHDYWRAPYYWGGI